MTLLDEVGRRSGEEVRHRALVVAAGSGGGPGTAKTRLRRRRVLAAVAAGVAAIALLPTLRAVADRSPGVDFADAPSAPPATAGTPGFSAGSGLVVLFDDGYDGVLAMDLDAGVAARRVLEGQRAGDQPWRLTREGDALVVGVDQIHVVSIATGESTLLGEATVSIPAAETGRVWLVMYPGRRIGEGTPTHRLVDLAGTVLLETPGLDPETSTPVIGVPGGLAYEGTDGVALWDAATGTERQLGTRQGWVADSAGALLVWCEGDCATLHLTDLEGEDREVPAPAGFAAFEPHAARLSPDGSRVAAIAGNGGPVGEGEEGALVVLDAASGEVLSTGTEVSRSARFGWSPDGSELLFTSSTAYGITRLGRYLVDEDRVEFARVPARGGVYDLVVLERDEAGAFLTGALGADEGCQAPGVFPSGRSGICGWRYADQ